MACQLSVPRRTCVSHVPTQGRLTCGSVVRLLVFLGTHGCHTFAPLCRTQGCPFPSSFRHHHVHPAWTWTHLFLALLQSILSWLAFAPSALPAGGLFEDQTPHLRMKSSGDLRELQATGRMKQKPQEPSLYSRTQTVLLCLLSSVGLLNFKCFLPCRKGRDATSHHHLLFSSPGHLSPVTLPISVFCSFPQWRPLLTLPHPVDSPQLGLALKHSHSLQSFPVW